VVDQNPIEYEVNFIQADLREREKVRQALEKIDKIDVLVNNAGVYAQQSVEDTSEELLDEIIDTNLKGPFLMSKYLVAKMKPGGSIINIASGLAVAPEPVSPAYCASKAGLLMLTKCMALYYGKSDIRVNAVLPGPIDTPMLTNNLSPEDLKIYQNLNPTGRIGTSDNVAEAVLFLASSKASYVNGGAYSVDGGESISSIYQYGGKYPAKP
jgi:NAD(P)-dependent dehydrogenase (short-subunit alcohol dehydrogenase family)